MEFYLYHSTYIDNNKCSWTHSHTQNTQNMFTIFSFMRKIQPLCNIHRFCAHRTIHKSNLVEMRWDEMIEKRKTSRTQQNIAWYSAINVDHKNYCIIDEANSIFSFLAHIQCTPKDVIPFRLWYVVIRALMEMESFALSRILAHYSFVVGSLFLILTFGMHIGISVWVCVWRSEMKWKRKLFSQKRVVWRFIKTNIFSVPCTFFFAVGVQF